MKKIIFYECELCRRRYTEKKHAEECERAKPPEYPIGCIYGDHKDSMYKNITFAVAKNRFTGHLNVGSSWACRDNGYGDSLGENTCGGNSLMLDKYHANLDFNHPTFKRMVNWLKSQNIPITVWDGEKAVPLSEYMSIDKTS